MNMLINLEVAQRNTERDITLCSKFDLSAVMVQWVNHQPDKVYLADPTKALQTPIVLIAIHQDSNGRLIDAPYTIQYFHPYAEASVRFIVTADFKVTYWDSDDFNWGECLGYPEDTDLKPKDLQVVLDRILSMYPNQIDSNGPIASNVLIRHTLPIESIAFN